MYFYSYHFYFTFGAAALTSAKELNKRANGTHMYMLNSYMSEFLWRYRIKIDKLDASHTIIQDIRIF